MTVTGTEVHSPGTRVRGTLLVCTGALAILGGMTDPTAGPDQTEWVPGLLLLTAAAALLIRALRLGITVYPDRVVSRGWLRTRGFSTSRITRVSTTGYSGFWTWGATSSFFVTVTLEVGDDTVLLRQITGRAPAMRGIADRIQRLVTASSDGRPGEHAD